MWPIVEKYFRSIEDCPKNIRKIFNDEMTLKADEYKTLISFMSFVLTLFNSYNMLTQVNLFLLTSLYFKNPKLPLPSLFKTLRGIKQKLQTIINDSYYGEETNILLEYLDHQTSTKLKNAFKV